MTIYIGKKRRMDEQHPLTFYPFKNVKMFCTGADKDAI